MKNPNRETVSKLEDLPNIGKKMASHLEIAGIKTPQSLIGKDAFALYDKLCKKTNKTFDPCVIDVFMSVIDFMEGGTPKAWWKFTSERKKLSLTI
ncbi:MAG: helix-hairpin-helix domain-containing protein [Campylobacterota bacterium]